MAACGNCGQGLRDGARFCGVCGQPVGPVPLGKQPTGKPATGKVAVTLPPPGPPAAGRTTNTTLIAVVVGILVLALGAGAAIVLTGRDDDTVTATDDGSPSAEPGSSTDDGNEDEAEDPAAEPTPTSSTTSSTTVPDDGLPPGEWAAVLYASTTFGPADQVRTELAHFGDVRVLDSSAYRTLKPGFSVVYVGGFLRSSGALDFCRAIGRYDRDSCHARYLSRDPSVTSWNTPGTDDARPEFVAYP